MNYIKNLVLTMSILLPSLISATAQPIAPSPAHTSANTLAVFYSIPGNIEEQYNQFVEEQLKSKGFNLTDPHKRVNDQYETKYGSTVLDVLSFLPVVNNKVIIPLLNIDPRIAGFAPFNMLVYKKLDENTTHVGHLMPKTMLDILGIENEEVREKFSATFDSLDESMDKELGGKKSHLSYAKLPKQKMINFEYAFEVPEDMDDFISEFQNRFELAFINKGYLIAGYHNFMEATENAEEILSGYDAFWTYSLCHLEFSYGMFDNKNAKPEAGLFAPCTMYMYIKKGTNKLVVGMYRLHNWSDALNIKDETRLKLVEKLDMQIPQILTEFGMKATENVNTLIHHANRIDDVKDIKNQAIKPSPIIVNNAPTAPNAPKAKKAPSIPSLPKVPKPIRLADTDPNDRSIKFSKRVPPNYIPHRFDNMKKMKSSTHTRIGEVSKGRISAYLRGEFMDVKSVEEKLKSAGFEVVTTAPVDKKGTLLSVVFTDKSLISLASKPNRGFIASLRALVDTKEKTISITNPLYMAKGFLQKEYDEKAAKKVLNKLITQFPNLKNSKDVLKFQLLPKYQFMNGMPYYENMIEVASGDDLLELIKNNKRVVFSQTLENGSTLIGIKLGKRTRKFTKRIGRNNAAMLPYPILIEDGKAKILDPKYYISYMYPMLKMSEFMTIATIPDAMVKDCERVFRRKK
ncbi:MAG: hypothetical protein U9O64_09625 [Campylobacterota bacterium]|nr:hypothetical protein [Campylobacterota bacterium]